MNAINHSKPPGGSIEREALLVAAWDAPKAKARADWL
jgi:hypothetical protein